MKNKSWSYYLILAALVVLMIVVANFRFKSSLPSGTIDIQLIPVFAVVILGSFDFTTSLLATIAATVILLILHWLSGPDLILLVLDWAAVAWVIWRHSHQPASRLISLTAGLSQVVAMTVIYLIIGWSYSHQLAGEWSFLGQIFPVALLSGLLYTLLIAPLINFVRWLLGRNGNSDHHDSDHNGSVEIDLSSHQHDNNKKS